MSGTRMDPTNYSNMISALTTFALKTSETCTEINTACNSCKTVLGEGDILFGGVSKDTTTIAAKYSELAETAKNIATLMQNELDLYYKKLQENATQEEFD